MSPRVKLAILVTLPILVGGALTTWLVWQSASQRTEARAEHFASAVVRQIAQTVTDPLMQEDALSLNVILGDLVQQGDIDFASVYSADNRLMPQAGRRTDSLQLFSADVTFQNTSAGYVRVGLDRQDLRRTGAAILALGLSCFAGLAAALGLLIWFYGDLVYVWLGAGGAMRKVSIEESDEAMPEAPEPTPTTQTLLVVKVRPARQLDAHFERIMQAISLYGGDAEVTDGDDLVIVFKRSEQLLKSACTAHLIGALMDRARGNIAVKSGMHVFQTGDEPADIEKARKHTTYLASIAEGGVLASRRLFETAQPDAGIGLEPFHSSLTPDGEVYALKLLGNGNRELIARQADQLTQSG